MKNTLTQEERLAEMLQKLSQLHKGYLLRLKEVAQILKVSLRTVQRRCQTGQLVYLKVERAVRVTVEALLQYIETHLVVKA